jgi:hypothetical protein
MKSKKLLCAFALWFCATHSFAHELPENRLTLVMREANHITMTFYIDYLDALHSALSPKTSEQEFMLHYSTMALPAFQKELESAHAKFAASTKINLSAGKKVTISNWLWPRAARIQTLLQEKVMQALVAPTAHAHPAPIEVRAEIRTSVDIDSLKLQLPEEFQSVTVVSYRPSQVVMKPKTPAPWIKFTATSSAFAR